MYDGVKELNEGNTYEAFLNFSSMPHNPGQQERLFEGLQLVGGKALSAGAGVVRGAGALLSWPDGTVHASGPPGTSPN